MKIIPETQDEWKSLISTTAKGTALVVDVLCTRGIAQFIVGRFYDARLNRALKDLQDIPTELKNEIQSKVSLDYIKSHDFLVFYSNALEEFVKVKNVEKIKYFRSVIINGMIRQDIEEGRKLLFIGALSSLSIDSLFLLKSINDMCAKNIDAHISFNQVRQRTDCKEASLLLANLKSLERYNLVELVRGQIRTNDYSHYAIIFGKFGREFLSFIMDYQ